MPNVTVDPGTSVLGSTYIYSISLNVYMFLDGLCCDVIIFSCYHAENSCNEKATGSDCCLLLLM